MTSIPKILTATSKEAPWGIATVDFVRRKVLRKSKASYNILVASGDPQERVGWVQILSSPELSIATVNDGQSALRTIRDHHIDAVIAAVAMPQMDGLELVREIREHSGSPALIIIAKGREKVDHVFLRICQLYGATATFTQPLNRDEFLSGVRKVLGLDGARLTEPEG